MKKGSLGWGTVIVGVLGLAGVAIAFYMAPQLKLPFSVDLSKAVPKS